MSYEDIASMKPDDKEKAVKDLLFIAQSVAILGSYMPITDKLAEFARRFL